MSYISEALKKAEREKLGKGDFKPDSVMGFTERKKRVIRRWQIAIFVMIIFLVPAVFSSYRFLERPVESVPRNSAPDLGKLYIEAREAQKVGDLVTAEVVYRKIIAMNGHHEDSLNNLGIICMTKGSMREAEAFFRKILTVNPLHVYGHYNLACLYAQEGRNNEAFEYLRKAILIDARVKNWAAADKDFLPIRNEKEFRKIVGMEGKEREP